MSEKSKKNQIAADRNIRLIMSKIRTPRTIDYLCKLIGEKPPHTRNLIARIRKRHPIYAFPNGDGYKFAPKKEAEKLVKYEEKTIRNHQKNLKVLKDYLGE